MTPFQKLLTQSLVKYDSDVLSILAEACEIKELHAIAIALRDKGNPIHAFYELCQLERLVLGKQPRRNSRTISELVFANYPTKNECQRAIKKICALDSILDPSCFEILTDEIDCMETEKSPTYEGYFNSNIWVMLGQNIHESWYAAYGARWLADGVGIPALYPSKEKAKHTCLNIKSN